VIAVGRWLLAIVLAFGSFGHATASNLYLSSEIVEGEFVRAYTKDRLGLVEIKVSAVHAGKFKQGDTLSVVALHFYRKAESNGWKTDALEPGDQMMLFLARAKSVFLYDIPEDAEVYWTAPSGLRLVHAGKAVGFSQWNNPGPYVALTGGAQTNTSVPTLTALREQIKQSIAFVKRWRPVLDGAGPSPAAALLELLRSRNQPAGFNARDHIAELASVRLANTHDPAVLVDALATHRGPFARSILARGFGTGLGREFLLEQIANAARPMTQRVEYAYMLVEAGPFFSSTNMAIAAESRMYGTVGDKANAHYLTRIARLALLQKDEGLCVALLTSLEGLLTIVGADLKSIASDAQGALAELTRARDGMAPEARHRIDLCFRAVSEEFPQFKLKTITGILRPRAAHDNYTAPPGRLAFEFSVAVHGGAPWSNVVSLVHAETGREWLVPTKRQFPDRTGAGGSDEVALPKDLPKGKYRVAYQLTNASGETNRSEYFEINLP
jgi:hypothetical protein